MKQNRPISITTVTALYIAAGIFLIIGIYMYTFGIETSKGAISNAGNKGSLPNSLRGNGVIILGLVTALYASILNYKRKKEI